MSTPEIATLVQLQEAETEIVRLKGVLEKVEKDKAKLASRLKQFEAAVKENREDLERVQKSCRDNEMEIRIVDERIIKSNETLRNVSTNKEYQVLLREVDDNKKRKDALESELIDLMDERERCQSILEESEKEFVQIQAQVEAEQAQVEKQSSDDRALLEEYQTRQKQIGETLDPALMDRFKKIARMNNGSAVTQAMDQVCMGCFMNVPPQLYIEVQRGNELISCPQCSRILYYEKS